MVFLGFLISLLPIFFHCDQQRRGYPSGYFVDLLVNTTLAAPVDSATVLSLLTDDYVSQLGTFNVKDTMIFGPFLGMCLPSLMDLMVEMYVAIGRKASTEIHRNTASTVIRLSMLERSVFIIGVICNSFYFLMPIDWNVMVIFIVREITEIISSVFVTAPLIMFLERTTNVFSPLFTTLIIFLLSCGNAIGCMSYNAAYDTDFHKENVVSLYMLIACYLLIISACLWSFLQFLFRQHTKVESVKDETNNHDLDPFVNFSTTRVPAAHVVALSVNCGIVLYFFLLPKPPPSVFNLLYTLQFFAAALVFAIEMRVRQNEVVIGLTQLELNEYEVRILIPFHLHPPYYYLFSKFIPFFSVLNDVIRPNWQKLKQVKKHYVFCWKRKSHMYGTFPMSYGHP